jgi:DNA repair protein RadC
MKTQTNRVRKNGKAVRIHRQVKSPAEFKIMRVRECPVDDLIMDTPPQIAAFWRKHVTTASWFSNVKECLCVFLFNTRLRLIGFELVSLGSLDTILFHPRDVFRAAVAKSAAQIIIAHNHPSGDPSPSEGDIKRTRELIRAGQVLKIRLLDHIIVGNPRQIKSFRSLRQLGYFYETEAGAA